MTHARSPVSIEVGGKTYWTTGKAGTRIANGAAAEEYEAEDKSRVWRETESGAVYPE